MPRLRAAQWCSKLSTLIYWLEFLNHCINEAVEDPETKTMLTLSSKYCLLGTEKTKNKLDYTIIEVQHGS